MTSSTVPSRPPDAKPAIPPLRNGDHLTRDDLHEKLNAYRRNGVREYVVERVWDAAIVWCGLREGRFERQPPPDGIYRSEVLPGLWLAFDAVLQGDWARVLAILQQGLTSPEHAAFVAGLEQR